MRQKSKPSKLSKRFKVNALMFACLTIFLTGCATEKVVYQTKKIYPPALLLRNCSGPLFVGETFRDLAVYAAKLQSSLDQCQADKSALQEWSQDDD